MRTTAKVLKYETWAVARGKWVVAYALFFMLLAEGLFQLGGGSGRTLLGLMNVVMILLPLVSLVYGSVHLYDSREFTELLLSQPVSRRQLFAGLYLGLTLPLSAAFLLGVGAPFAWHGLEPGHSGALWTLLATGVLLTHIFVAMAFLIAIRVEDKARGLGLALVLWLGFGILYDGLVLLGITVFSAYPLEKAVLALTLLNPIDLARMLLLLQLDLSALMGYTGAVFQGFFGSFAGLAVAAGSLLAWLAAPLLLSARLFRKKDF